MLLGTYLLLNVLEVCLKLVCFPHRPVQTLIWLRVHVAYDTLHADVSRSMSVRMNLDSGIPVFWVIIVLARIFIVLSMGILVVMIKGTGRLAWYLPVSGHQTCPASFRMQRSSSLFELPARETH